MAASATGGAAADADPALAAFNAKGNKKNAGNKKKKDRGNANNTAGNRQPNQANANTSHPSGRPRDSDNPPTNTCKNHWEFGKQAYCCLNPFECPWKDSIVPRPKKN